MAEISHKSAKDAFNLIYVLAKSPFIRWETHSAEYLKSVLTLFPGRGRTNADLKRVKFTPRLFRLAHWNGARVKDHELVSK